jgi:uncharacterized membrane protein
MLMARSTGGVAIILAALLIAQGTYWFTSGAHSSHSTARNALVILELLVGVALIVISRTRAV